MQRFIRVVRSTLLVAFFFPFFSLVSTFAGAPAPTPSAIPPKVATRIAPVSNSTARAVGQSLTGPSRVFLPLIHRAPGVKPLQKVKTGIHLGNRDADWASEMLNPFTDNPTNPNPEGTWPKIIVAQSRQIFDITRGTDCRITGVAVKNWNAYSLLRDAARYNGSQIIIRITPSPGNFEEVATVPNWRNGRGRTMIAGTWPDYSETPGNLSQCGSDGEFRTVADIGDEMIAIQLFVSSQYYGWVVSGFEPANEPNTEWYRGGDDPTAPALYQRRAWDDMDDYFDNLYLYVSYRIFYEYPNLYMRVFTPPMAMLAYAEMVDVRDCSTFTFADAPVQGYEIMFSVFNSEVPSNDGYSWHNYFSRGKEGWDVCRNGHHVSMYFPYQMYYNLAANTRPGVITEADLASAAMSMDNPITNKDADPVATFNSINTFVSQELRAQAVAIWLLNDNIQNPGTHPEHSWHEAYDSDSSPSHFRDWFWQWWNYSQ